MAARPRSAQTEEQRLQQAAFFDGSSRIPSMLEGVFVAARSAGPRCAAVHPTTFTAHRRRFARFARAGFGPTAWAGKHRSNVARMIARHFLLNVRDFSLLARDIGTGTRSLFSSTSGIATIFASTERR